MLSMGYRYDWRNGFLRETGAISIDIKPNNAKVYLNDIELKSGIPIRLNNITPRKYLLKITATGFYDWEKEIEVKNKQTIYIKEISLLKKSNPQKISENKANDLKLSTDGRYLAYYFNDNIWAYDKNNKTEKIILNWKNKKNPTIEWGKKQNILMVAEENSDEFFIIDFNKEKQWQASSPDKKNINKYEWQEVSEPELVFSTETSVFVARPNTQKIIKMTENKYQNWSMENGALWTAQKNTNTNQIEIIKDTLGFAQNISNNISFTDNLNSDIWQLSRARENIALIKKNNSSEMIIINNGKYFKINGEKSIISDYNSWWLIWTPWELVSFSDGREPVMLNRSGEQLQQVWPLDEYNTLALIWSDKTTILFPYYDVGHSFLNRKINGSAVDNKNKILYFSSSQLDKSGIWELNY